MNKWQFAPEVQIDIGLGKTESSNSILLRLPFTIALREDNIGGRVKEPPVLRRPATGNIDENPENAEGKDLSLLGDKKLVAGIPTYKNWSETPWYRSMGHHFYIGPKIETDKKFALFNVLGNAEFRLRFHRLMSSISDQRRLMKFDLEQQGFAADQVQINSGFRFIPYVGTDFGGKVTADVVENKGKKIRQVVPQYKIFRAYTGFNSILQWNYFSLPMSITIDERIFYLFTQEIVGSVTDEGIDLRKINRFQHRGTASFDIYFDPAKRYSFNISYENGRKAPRFAYLNKATAGFKFIF